MKKILFVGLTIAGGVWGLSTISLSTGPAPVSVELKTGHIPGAMQTQNRYDWNTRQQWTEKLGYGIGFDYKTIVITAVSDNITINYIKTNRGNCNIQPNSSDASATALYKLANLTPLPATLEFGKSYSYNPSDCANILEVEVETNKGSWTFNWNAK